MDLAALVKRHRLAAGLTQEELAERAEVSARTVSDVERGLRNRIYRDTAGRLATALGLDAEQRAEFVAAARGKPGRPHEPRRDVPAPPTALIGRDRELATIAAALARPDLRLITLTGAGGVGKTRLAVEVARRMDVPVTFVDLGELTEASLVLSSIAGAVAFPAHDKPTAEAIAAHIGDDPMMLVLDTFEHVLAAAPEIARLLATARWVRFLVTSREALHVRGEHEIVVPPLDVGASSAALELFVERASAVSDEGALDPVTAQEICRRLGGLPLAIELAAARAKHLPLPVLRDQLDRSLVVLTNGPRDLPRRQQTMRDTIAWSYDLLTPEEQNLFRDLCVFSGGWTLAQAAWIHASNVLEGCSSLQDKSLVVRDGDRHHMLDVIREFGAEQGISDGARARHLAAFVALAERAESHLGRAEQRAWIERLAQERGNVRTALRFAIDSGDGESALRLCGSIWRFWMLHGDFGEGREWCRRSLTLSAPESLRSKALWGVAWLAYHQGDYDDAARCSDEMMSVFTGDPVDERNARTIRGIVDLASGHVNQAIASFETCVELMRERERDWLVATSLLNLGMATLHARDPRAPDVLGRALETYRALGDENFAARTEVYVGYDALLGGDVDGALRACRRAVVAFWELDDVWGTTEALELACGIAAARERAEDAALLFAATQSQRTAITTSPFPLDRVVIEQCLARVRALASEHWTRWLERGRALSLEDAVEIAMR